MTLRVKDSACLARNLRRNIADVEPWSVSGGSIQTNMECWRAQKRSNGYGDTYTNSNPNSYSYSNGDSASDGNANGYYDGNWNSKRTPASYPNAAAAAYSRAAPVVAGRVDLSTVVRRSVAKLPP